MRAWARHWIALSAVLCALVSAQYGFFFFRDNFSTHYPAKVLTAQALRSGEIPWWNFHDGGGQPLAGNPNTLTFYPDNVLLLFLPAHAAFNLHFLIHLAGGFLAMRALCRARGASPRVALVAATIYVLSGAVVSSTAFYNLVTAVALIPLALLGVERRSTRIVGASFGLLLLAAEPVMLGSAVLAVAIAAWRRFPLKQLALAALLAAAIGAPQILAYSEIAGEVERASTFSARTVLATSLTPLRVAEIFTWPLSGFLNEAGGVRQRLFSTIFIGFIALVALFRRSRYTLLALLLLALAIGRYDPLVTWAVEAFDGMRVMRFPEKFALPLTVALVVLIADFLQRSAIRRVWTLATVLPLLGVAVLALPIDHFAPYRLPRREMQQRVFVKSAIGAGQRPAREEYRMRARALEPLFGATGGLRYALVRSPDRMHSQLSRVVLDRFVVSPPNVQSRYLQIAGVVATDPSTARALVRDRELAPRSLRPPMPLAAVIPLAVGAPSAASAALFIERARELDPAKIAVAPMPFRSAEGRVTSYEEKGQRIAIDVAAAGPVLLFVNQSYFSAWRATLRGEDLETFPIDVDRLGVIVPRGGRVELEFGRHRLAVAVAWLASIVLLLACAFGARVEERDRGAGEVERAADEDRALV